METSEEQNKENDNVLKEYLANFTQPKIAPYLDSLKTISTEDGLFYCSLSF